MSPKQLKIKIFGSKPETSKKDNRQKIIKEETTNIKWKEMKQKSYKMNENQIFM